MRNALPPIAILALLGGCSAGETHLTTAIPVQQAAVRSAMSSSPGFVDPLSGALNGEVFKGRYVQVNPSSCSSRDTSASFSASGTAAGPYPGTFTAQGTWKASLDWNVNKYAWSLNESFTISSGSSQITGTISGTGFANPDRISCNKFPAVKNRRSGSLKYQTAGGGGTAAIFGITNDYFRESFH